MDLTYRLSAETSRLFVLVMLTDAASGYVPLVAERTKINRAIDAIDIMSVQKVACALLIGKSLLRLVATLANVIVKMLTFRLCMRSWTLIVTTMPFHSFIFLIFQ